MGDTFELLQRELLKAIGPLQDDQLFTVIWFNEGPRNCSPADARRHL